jgi:hypothetical protein
VATWYIFVLETKVAMPKKEKGKSFTLAYTAEVKITLPKLQFMSSLKYLDADALSHVPKIKIDVGFFKTPCCDRHLRAVIKDGMVTGLEMDPCSDLTPASAELSALAKTALKHAKPPGTWKPVPVREYLSRAEEINERETNCVEFTFLGHTFFCCQTGRGPVSCVYIEPIVAKP